MKTRLRKRVLYPGLMNEATAGLSPIHPGIKYPYTPHCPLKRESLTEEIVETWSKGNLQLGTPEFQVPH